MPENLVDLVKGYLTPDIVDRVASSIGESSGATQKTLSAAVPTLIGSLASLASTSGGASRIAQMLDDGKYDGGALANVAGLVTGGATQSMIGAGKGILATLFGSQLDGVIDVVARAGGVRTGSATSLLALIAPIIMHIIGRQRGSFGPSLSSLSGFLTAQSGSLGGLLPAGLVSLLGWPSPGATTAAVGSTVPAAGARAEQGIDVAADRERRAGWLLPLGVAAALLLFGLVYLWSPPTGTVDNAAQSVSWKMADLTLPGGRRISVPDNSFNFGLANWLAGTSDVAVPKRFLFDNLNFETGTTKLTPESLPTLDSLVAILKAYPPVSVGLEGFTDNTGDVAANQKLSLDRAEAVKSQMVGRGIDGGRISTAGFGADKPVASNDTDDGRAKNRRLELVVQKR
jgi:outer membrane protein OmpA-like peptidoglycan-associated protein